MFLLPYDRIWFVWFIRINFNFKFSWLWFINLVPFCVRYIDILSFCIFWMLINLFLKRSVPWEILFLIIFFFLLEWRYIIIIDCYMWIIIVVIFIFQWTVQVVLEILIIILIILTFNIMSITSGIVIVCIEWKWVIDHVLLISVLVFTDIHNHFAGVRVLKSINSSMCF